ncbi:hypothetical protein GCM10007100_13300 [Roseibacillus persicicus]|uniref:Sulfatase N-terminal domain-containing protein n=2 Tax=Roseibacillus persicicus TaxID=454148 RepID=A0A918WJI9_9BACT|nr:hypothetical protein GCM10007100_13300 [Roseibacillus persicicus]
MRPLSMSRLHCSTLLAAFVSLTSEGFSQTNLSGSAFDLDGTGSWDNGTPGAGNDGFIAIDYDFSALGAGDNGNMNPLPSGAFSVTQTAGNGTGGQFNLVGNPDFTFHLNGGSLSSTSGTFFVNGHRFRIDGGALTTTNQARLRGDFTISSGSFSTPNLDLEENTVLTLTGGTITTTSNIAINQSNAGEKTANLQGGSFVNGSATSLLTNANVTLSIGGDFSFNAPSVTALFNSSGGSSGIHFSSDWTGSMTLDSATAWDDVFEAEWGRVTVDGVSIAPGEFETFFLNTNGVITLSSNVPPPPSSNVEISSVAPTAEILSANNLGTTFSRIFDEDRNTNHARGQLFDLGKSPSGGYQITGITIHKNSSQTFSNDTLSVRLFSGSRTDWDSGTGHSTSSDRSNYFAGTQVNELYSEPFLLNGPIAGDRFVTLEFAEPVFVPDESSFGFLLTYDESSASSPDYFQYNEGETQGRIQVTATAHETADTRHLRYFVHGNAFEDGFPTTDEDEDGLFDIWETVHFGNLEQTASDNPDGDWLDNLSEQSEGTNPNLADTDSDGLDDDVEVAGVTDPTNPDSDGDSLLDGVESNSGSYLSSGDTGTNPLLADTDSDGINDGIEITLGSDPFDNTKQPAERPNIIFIMIDDLDTREIGVYGQATLKTPRVDQMAAEGMMFTDYYTASPVCHSCRSQLMTGQDSRRGQDRTNSVLNLEAERVTIAETLKQAGYTTGCVGKWGLGTAEGTGAPWNQGFDFFCGYLDQVNAHRFFPKFLWRNQEQIYFDQALATANGSELYIPGAQNFNTQTDDWNDAVGNVCSHDVVVSEGLQFIEDNADQPFFLYCAWTPPHAYFYNAARVEALTDADGLIYDHTDPEQTLLEELYPGAPFGTDGQGRPRFVPHTYATMVSAADRDTGRIIDKLFDPNEDGDSSDSIADNTLVIFCSDNGEDEPTFLTAQHLKLGFNDLRGMKRDTYEGGIRSPFIAWWPGKVPAGSTSDVIGTFADMLPTFAEVAGLATPPHLTGRSILPALLGGDESTLEPREYHYWEFPGFRSVRKGDWKLVRTRNDINPPNYELFNLASDPLESNDLSGSESEILNRLIPLIEGTHEVPVDRYYRDFEEFFVQSGFSDNSGFKIRELDGSGASNGYSLTSTNVGYGFNYLPFETGLSQAVTFDLVMQFPSGGAGSFLLGASDTRAEALALRIDSDNQLLEVLSQGNAIASGQFQAADFAGNRAELTLAFAPTTGVGEVQLGDFSLSFSAGTSFNPLQFWGYEVENTTMETSRPRWKLGSFAGAAIDLKQQGGSLFGSYQLPLSVGETVVPQYSFNLETWYDHPPGLRVAQSSGSQGEVFGFWALPDDNFLRQNSERLFLRYRSGK